MPLLYCIALLLVLSPALAPAQSDTYLNNREQRWLADARAAINRGEYATAEQQLDRLLQNYPDQIDLLLMRGSVREYRRDLVAAQADYERALQLQTRPDPRLLWVLGEVAYQRTSYDTAAIYLSRYLDQADSADKNYTQAQRLLAASQVAAELRAHPVEFRPERLSETINTASFEYFPGLSVDGSTLIFTRQREGDEDFYASERLADGSWGEAQPIVTINTPTNEAAQTISADGTLLVFAACNRQDGRGSCDLYYSERRDDRWTPPANLGNTINTADWDSHPSLSANGRLLFFASNRPGGRGGSDLWASARRTDGQWTPPINLGDVINTEQDEKFPYFHPDGQTLYFVSNGHPGLGGDDVFFSRLDTAQRWGLPINLGYPINTESNETSLFISLDGTTAYFASDKRAVEENWTVKTTDIYTFELPPAARPSAATYVEARVVNAKTGQPIAARVDLAVLETGQRVERRRADEAGRFLIVLPVGKTYALQVDEPGYLLYSDQFALGSGYTIGEPYRLTIELQPLSEVQAGQPIVLKNVLFATGRADLLPASRLELDRLLVLLRENPELRIQINGHTDDVGKDDTNQQLSEARARAVQDYLIEQGIAAERLRHRGYGENRPLVPNDNATNRALNRRTEFEVLR